MQMVSDTLPLNRFLFLLAACAAMLTAVPLAPVMALGAHAPLYTHFIFMLGHANVLHWAVNAYTLLLFHRYASPGTLLAAYTLAVALSFLLPVHGNVLGLSVITAFLIGCWMPAAVTRQPRAVALTAAFAVCGFFIPHTAALWHVAMMAAGAAAGTLYRFFTRQRPAYGRK